MNNEPKWQSNIEDPYVWPIEEVNRVKEIYDSKNLTRSYSDWNYQHPLANNTFDMKSAFDTIISTLERSYYHDMLKSDLISGFYKHTGSTTQLVATNRDPKDFLGGDLDRIPGIYLEPRDRHRDISTAVPEGMYQGEIAVNPITHRTQVDIHHDFYGQDLAVKLGVTWFRYVWTWDFIDPLDREIFERTKLLNKWIDKKTFCQYHDIFQHSLLVYVNGLPVNDFEVMFTAKSNVLKLPFDNKVFIDIQRGEPVPVTIYRIASKKHYYAKWNYITMLDHEGKWNAETLKDYRDIFDDGDTDLVILNLCEAKTQNNLAYRELQQTEMMQGPQTCFLHLHKDENGNNYLDLHDLDPQILSWWKSVNSVNVDFIRPKNMHEYSLNGEYPYLVKKDTFGHDSDIHTDSYDLEYLPIDLTHELEKDNGHFIGVSEEDVLLFKQFKDNSKPGKEQIQDGWRPVEYNLIRTYPNTYRVDDGSKQNDIVEIRPYETYYDTINDVNEKKVEPEDLGVTQVQIDYSDMKKDPYPDLRVFYFIKTLYKDTQLEPLVLQALKTARRYAFNPYRYTKPTIKNLDTGTEFTIRENGVIDEPYIIISHDSPIKGKTLCMRKYAIPDQLVENDFFDYYEEQFKTPTMKTDVVSGDRYHLYGKFGIPTIQFMEKESIPFYDAEKDDINHITTRFFDLSSDEFNQLDSTIKKCFLRLDQSHPVKYRLRDQSSSIKTYGKPHERPAYKYVDESGAMHDNMQPNEKLYLRPCVLLDNEFDFIQHDGEIHIELPDYLTPYPLTNFSDQELLKIITTNRQYFLKYFKLLFPTENFYGVEKYYKYSDDNMANLMQITEPIPNYDVIGDGIEGSPVGDGTIMVDRESIPNLVNQNYWHVTRATIAYIPDKVDPYYIENGWKKNYSINTHVLSSTGVELVVNMAKYHDFPTVQYKKHITFSHYGYDYVVNDKIYIRNQSMDELVVYVKEVDGQGRVRKISADTWTDTTQWSSISQVIGGHGQALMFTVTQENLPGVEEMEYYPYVGMELHIEHDQVYNYDPSGTYLNTTLISGTGEGLQVNIEAEHIPYQKEADLDAWMYPFDYLTLKLKNFIYLHPDNFMDYLKRQYRSPFVDWNIRVFHDTDLSEYKRYHSGNFLTYNAPIDLKTNLNYVEFLMPPGYHSKLKDIKVYREYDVYSTGDETELWDGEERPVYVSGRRLINHLDDSGDIFNGIWDVTVLTEDGIWASCDDPEYDVKFGFRLRHRSNLVFHMDQEHSMYPNWDIPDVTSCTVHMEFLAIRDSAQDDMWQDVSDIEKFDSPKFLVKFDNEPKTEISYRPFVAGFEKDFCEKAHYDTTDYVYYDFNEIYQLKKSFLYKHPEHHKLYKLKDYEIIVNTVTGLNYHPGMELHLAPITESSEAYDKVQILAIVDSVVTNPLNTVLQLHIHDFQRVFLDYDPTGDWKVILTDFQQAQDKFHRGVGEQTSYDDWERIHWFSDPSNKESTETPIIHLEGMLIEDQWINGEKHYVNVNNTFTLRKLFHYDWEESFVLSDNTDGVVLSPIDNPNNEVHLEDLRIIDTDKNELIPFDYGDGKELFTLQDIIPDVNRSVQFRNRYDIRQIRIGESLLNMKQTLYDFYDATTHGLRYVSDIRQTFTVKSLRINPMWSEYVSSPITLLNIEPGNETNCMDTYYIPESTFRSQWNIPSAVKFDHRDYTMTHQPLYDTSGKVIMYVDIDIRCTTLPFNFSGNTELINNYTRPVLNNRPYPPIGPSHPSWKFDMRYFPSTDEYVANYMSNGGISPNKITDIDWKPTVYVFPFQINDTTASIIAKGTNTHSVENKYIRIKHIYNIQPADGVQTIPRSDTISSPSSQYNNHTPEAYTMGELTNYHQMNQNDKSSYHRFSNSYSYEDPPIFIHLTHKLKNYTGLVFTYSDGYEKRLLHIGENKLTIHLRTDKETKPVDIRVYVGKREDDVSIPGNWVYQDAYGNLRPPFDDQNYQHKYGFNSFRENNGRGQYVLNFALETYYEPSLNRYTSATNTYSGNYGTPNFYYPDQETPKYKAKCISNGKEYSYTVSKDDHYYPTYSDQYFLKIHEDSMRNAGYNDSDFTPYQSQFGLWYEFPDTVIQGSQSTSDSLPAIEEDWAEIGSMDSQWDYNYDGIIDTEIEYVVDAFANMDQERDSIHFANVRHTKVHIHLWQSEKEKEGYIQHTDVETGLKYSVKVETEKPERQFVPWKIYGDPKWTLYQTSWTDNWWNHANIPFSIPYSLYGTLETDKGIEAEDHLLHKGNYWICLTPKQYYQGALLVAGTKEQISSVEAEEGDQSLVLMKDHYQIGTYKKNNWEYKDIDPENNMTYTVLMYQGMNQSVTLMFMHGEFIVYEDAQNEFSPDGDKFELYAETRMYYIFTAYERGIISSLHSYSIPWMQCHDLSYLYGTDYNRTIFTPIYEEKLYAGNPYFYEGYQKFYAQIITTDNEELMWIPVWTYISEDNPPYDEDDPNRKWHLIDQMYITRSGKELPVHVAYHKEDFPKDIPYSIKESHHTYFNKTKDIYYTCVVTHRHVKEHDLSVYPTPRYSVHELSFGLKYTDIQKRFRVVGKKGNYKAVIHLSPNEVSTSCDGMKHPAAMMNSLSSKDRLTVRATRKDGSTYDVPLMNVPSLVKPLEIINQTNDHTDIQYNGIKQTDVKWTFVQNPYPKNTVFSMAAFSKDGVIDLNHPYMKRRWIRSQLDSDRYEIIVNGRVLTHEDQYTIITPTKLVLHGMTSLHNLEINEINREPTKELFYPKDMTSTIDKILEGTLIDGTYQHEFNQDEQANFIPYGTYPQLSLDDDLYPYYPINVDMDINIRDVSNEPDELQENDYQYMTSIPYLEGAPIVTNIRIGEYYPYRAAGMDVLPIPNIDITNMVKQSFTEKFQDGRHDISDSPLHNQIRIMWDDVYQSEQTWKVPYQQKRYYNTNYLLDERYRDHFPQYNYLFGEIKDNLYQDPTDSRTPPLLERDWVRYHYNQPNIPIRNTFRSMYDPLYHYDQEWILSKTDPQIIHGARWNWKGWQKPASTTDKTFYVMWKTNSNANKEKPWENQGNNSYYEPNMVFVEQDPTNYFSYLGDYIQSHYDAFSDTDIGVFRGYNGWYPWRNSEYPLLMNNRYWDTDRIKGQVTQTQSPYSVQVNNDTNRMNPELLQYEYINASTIRIYLDGVYEGEYSKYATNIHEVRMLLYDAETDNLVSEHILPKEQPQYIDITALEQNKVYDVYVDFANRAGIRHGKKFKIDPFLQK